MESLVLGLNWCNAWKTNDVFGYSNLHFSTDTCDHLCKRYEELEKSHKMAELNQLKCEVEMTLMHMEHEQNQNYVKSAAEGKKQA